MDSPSIEEAVLSAIYFQAFSDIELAKKTIKENDLAPIFFQDDNNRLIYKEIIKLLKENERPNEILIAKALESDPGIAEAGGYVYVSEVLNCCATDAGISKMISKLRVESTKQKAGRMRAELAGTASSMAVADCKKLLEEIEGLENGEFHKPKTRLGIDVLDEYLQSLEEGELAAIPTGYKEIDEIIAGWQSTLNILVAHPGVGKSAMIAGSIHRILKRGEKVGLCSLEDPGHWVLARILAKESGVSTFAVRNGKSTRAQFQRLMDKVGDVGHMGESLFVYDDPDDTSLETVMKEIAIMFKKGASVVFVDHLGEFKRPGKEPRDIEIGNICRALRSLTKKYKKPIVLATHLARKAQGAETAVAHSEDINRIARVMIKMYPSEEEKGKVDVMVTKNTGLVSKVPITMKVDVISAILEEDKDGHQKGYNF